MIPTIVLALVSHPSILLTAFLGGLSYSLTLVKFSLRWYSHNDNSSLWIEITYYGIMGNTVLDLELHELIIAIGR